MLTMATDLRDSRPPMTRRHRTLTHLLCLFAYLWSAVCLGENLLIHQFVDHDPHALVEVADIGRDAIVFHHAGHRDVHEPDAADSRGASADSEHADHTVTLSCDDASLGVDLKKPAPLAKPASLTISAALPLPSLALFAGSAPSRPAGLSTGRNTPIATLKLTRLRI